MALVKRSTPEEKAAKAAARSEQQDAAAEEKRRKTIEAQIHAFWSSPAGEARQAFDRGDHVYQYQLNVTNQQAIVVAMVGARAKSRTIDPTAVLNSVAREGWEIVSGNFVFVMTGQQSRDKFMSSGQNVAVAGTVVGYYVFKRCEENRQAESAEALEQRIAAQVS